MRTKEIKITRFCLAVALAVCSMTVQAQDTTGRATPKPRAYWPRPVMPACIRVRRSLKIWLPPARNLQKNCNNNPTIKITGASL